MKRMMTFALLAGWVGLASGKTHDVEITPRGYNPMSLEILAGDTVRWTNVDRGEHSATADDGSWDTGLIGPRETAELDFKEAARYRYHCEENSDLTGQLTVTDGGGGKVHEVTITERGYDPRGLRIKPGDTVRWTNVDSEKHTATADDETWDTGTIGPRESVELSFRLEAEYGYHCELNSRLRGELIVGDGGGGNVHEVTITARGYDPPEIQIKPGETVRWTNADSEDHTATADDESWDTGVIGPRESVELSFRAEAKYGYHCELNPRLEGRLIVGDGGGGKVHEVMITGRGYDPAELQIKPGETVRWTNVDSEDHTATADDESWDTGVIGPRESVELSFRAEAKYGYHCELNSRLEGRLIVGEGGGGCDLMVKLSDQPRQISRGETLEFTTSVINECDEPRVMDEAFMVIEGPDDLKKSLYSGPPVLIAAGATISRKVRLPVPRRAEPGNYSLEVTVANAGERISQDAFKIVVD